ncbi:cation:proton antiporter [Olsenella sp. AF16-14LB]|jgi:Kef-type K+ transport system membrane component KefB|uniref:cation:proton antiporter n=1 Tax=Atopobiaceae TaxID=1643824 RepID=UPI00068A2684|nr:MULTISPECIES: cation:proton antiporter [unclassified Olsenella]RGJ46381.1 cation:proton antiporter [Olsenella sp. TM06-36]RGS52588.1 cation:proton antiporter [Olsenella sp. AF21-51]RGU52408.1 cation:proton antiporter [Olsenella sp. AF16-14LB]RGU83650.1 cation:proton antiporter [Olsenella sp. AF15-43LB]RHB56366.1 cation:proton antiporter [Olsenella sp. AM39-30AC]
MVSQLLSLSVTMLVAALAPFVASLVPGRAIPEVVFLVFAGALLGPYGADVIRTSGGALSLVSELGMAFLFLMAGYEIKPSELVGTMGRHASICWGISLAAAIALVSLTGFSRFTGMAGIAFAIMLTTTAYGTLAPIMRARDLTNTSVGRAVTAYGATGEVLPVIAVALMLSTRSLLVTVIVLVVFMLVCVRIAHLSTSTARIGARFRDFVRSSAGATTQTPLRLVVLLLVFLLFLAEVAGFDSVLGAFAAGFVLRVFFPDGSDELETRLEAIGNGFLIPAFFVISGAGIDLSAALADPGLLFLFIGLLIAVRGVSVAVSLRVNPETRMMEPQERFVTTAYCVMALPLVVAITQIVVDAGAMTSQDASVLVTAGAITVLVVPVLTSLVRVTAPAHPVHALSSIVSGEESANEALERQRRAMQTSRRRFEAARARRRRDLGRTLSSAEYIARHGGDEPSDDSPSNDGA